MYFVFRRRQNVNDTTKNHLYKRINQKDMQTQLVVTGLIFYNNKLLLIHHKKLDLWLGVGGHIEENETPDQALRREIKEEVGIPVQFLQPTTVGLGGETHTLCAVPFHVSTHRVKDHDHCSLTYLCEAQTNQIVINKEIKGFQWVTKEELHKQEIPLDVQRIGKEAFRVYEGIKNGK